ncbi:phospholipase effector Tle1 domain-containing protein [Bradyrhizobium sp. USDA 4473]
MEHGGQGPQISVSRHALRLDNKYAFHALALDEHRKNFEPTFWTRTDRAGHEGAAERQIDKVEQRWFVGAHAIHALVSLKYEL